MSKRSDRARDFDELFEKASAVVDTQRRIIHSVTPSHPDCLGPSAEDQERYQRLFSRWHRTTREMAVVVDRMKAAGLSVDENAPGGARSTDPTTSRSAALTMIPKSGTKRRAVYDAIVAAGSRGATSAEAEAASGVAGAWKRITELHDGGHIQVTGSRFDPRTGKDVQVYVAQSQTALRFR